MLDINKCVIKESGIVISLYGCSEFHNKIKAAIYNNYPGITTFYSFETINQPQKINKSNKGLLSSNYISSLSNTPSCIISIFDISERIFSNESPDNISISILNDICTLKQEFHLSPLIVIILNTTNNSSVSSSVKNLIISYGHANNINYLLDKNILLLYSKERLFKEEFLNGLSQSIIANAGVYYNLKKKKIKKKITENQSIIKQEKLAKYYIKLGLISLSVHKEKKNYSYFQKAYNILTSFIERNTYIYSDSNDIRIVYMNIRNACDFLFVNILKDKNINTEIAIGRTINHISFLSSDNFFLDNEYKDKKDLIIELWDLQWRYEIYEYVSSKFNTYYFEIQKINTMQRKIDLFERNKDKIDNLLNYSIDNKIFKVDNEYIEKFPKYYHNDNEIIKDVDYILKLVFIEENKEQLNRTQNKNIFKKIINDFAFKDHSHIEDIQNQQRISFYAINIARENKNIFTCEERIVMLSMILSKSYKFYNTLIKFTKLFLNLFNEYAKLLYELNLCDYTLISESNKNLFDVYIKNLFLIFSFRKFTIDENNTINSLFSAKITNPYQFRLQPNSFIKINSVFKCDTQVYLFTLVDYSVDITSEFDLNLEIEKITLRFTNDKRNSTHKYTNLILSQKSPSVNITKQFFINKNDIQYLFLTTVIIKLKNTIELIISSNEINTNIKNNSFICVKEQNESENPVSILFPKEVQMPVNNWKLFSFPITSHSSIIIRNVKAIISIVSPYAKKPDNEFSTIFFGEIAQIANDALIIKTDLISERIQFLLRVFEIGNFTVAYIITLHIAHKDLQNDIQKIKFFGQTDINVIMPFSINNTIISPLYMLVDHHHVINSTNTIIKSNVTLTNLTNEDIYINDLVCIPNHPGIIIETLLTELIKLGKKNIIFANSSFSIPFNITFIEGNNGSPGSFELQWQSDSLRNYANDKVFNALKVNFDIINANNLSIDIFSEHKKVDEQIEYRLMIKNTSEKQIYFTNIEIENKSEYYYIDGNVSINSQIFEPLSLKTYTLTLISKSEKKNLTKLPLVKVQVYSFNPIQKTNYLIVYNPSYCLI